MSDTKPTSFSSEQPKFLLTWGDAHSLRSSVEGMCIDDPQIVDAIDDLLTAHMHIAALERENAELRAVVERVITVLDGGGFSTMAATIRAQASIAAQAPPSADDKEVAR